MELSKTRPLTLMIDEFQDFNRVNSAIFSQIQKIWDKKKGEAKINLIVCGSVYSMMTKLFLGKKEPLYGRQTEFMKIEPFAPLGFTSFIIHIKMVKMVIRLQPFINVFVYLPRKICLIKNWK